MTATVLEWCNAPADREPVPGEEYVGRTTLPVGPIPAGSLVRLLVLPPNWQPQAGGLYIMDDGRDVIFAKVSAVAATLVAARVFDTGGVEKSELLARARWRIRGALMVTPPSP